VSQIHNGLRESIQDRANRWFRRAMDTRQRRFAKTEGDVLPCLRAMGAKETGLRVDTRRKAFRHRVVTDWPGKTRPWAAGPTFPLVVLGHARHKQPFPAKPHLNTHRIVKPLPTRQAHDGTHAQLPWTDLRTFSSP